VQIVLKNSPPEQLEKESQWKTAVRMEGGGSGGGGGGRRRRRRRCCGRRGGGGQFFLLTTGSALSPSPNASLGKPPGIVATELQIAHFNAPHHPITVSRPFFWDHPGEPVPEENFWTSWCKGRLTEADTPTIRLHFNAVEN